MKELLSLEWDFSIFMFEAIHLFHSNEIFVCVVAAPPAPSAAAGCAAAADSAVPPGE